MSTRRAIVPCRVRLLRWPAPAFGNPSMSAGASSYQRSLPEHRAILPRPPAAAARPTIGVNHVHPDAADHSGRLTSRSRRGDRWFERADRARVEAAGEAAAVWCSRRPRPRSLVLLSNLGRAPGGYVGRAHD
jgi:hypothetical protein